MPAPSTPCVKICRLEPVSGLCTGCGRTLDEIARWGAIGEAERRAIMAAARGRLVRLAQPAPERAF